jgi:hypothetical protein
VAGGDQKRQESAADGPARSRNEDLHASNRWSSGSGPSFAAAAEERSIEALARRGDAMQDDRNPFVGLKPGIICLY